MSNVIVIPIYKERPSVEELSSYKNCLNILGKYDIYIACHRKLNLKEYLQYCKNSVEICYFDEMYFKSIEGYSRLLMTNFFYKTFSKYEYMLIYQLDAWVFRDELDYWCQKGYDYIGAPWFERQKTHEDDMELDMVGNGGLSLRKIQKFIEITTPYTKLRTNKEIFQYKSKNIKEQIRKFLYFLGWHNTIGFISKVYNGFPEDTYFCKYLYEYSNVRLNVPNVREAAQFAFECSPRYMYNFIGNELPFGCHAWERYDKEFWKDKIIIDNYETLNNNNKL